MVSACDGLLLEAWGKLKAEEKKRGDRLRKVVRNFLEMHPIIKEFQGEVRIDTSNLKKFNELIILYEQTMKVFLDDHNLNAPNYEDNDGL
jgi:hypothetical protein